MLTARLLIFLRADGSTLTLPHTAPGSDVVPKLIQVGLLYLVVLLCSKLLPSSAAHQLFLLGNCTAQLVCDGAGVADSSRVVAVCMDALANIRAETLDLTTIRRLLYELPHDLVGTAYAREHRAILLACRTALLQFAASVDMAASEVALAMLFGDVEMLAMLAIKDSQQERDPQSLSDLFLQLTHAQVVRWAASDRLTVDHENSVLLMLDYWWHKSPNKQADRARELAACVRLRWLSNGFLFGVVHKLEWFNELLDALDSFRVCHATRAEGRSVNITNLIAIPPAWDAAARCAQLPAQPCQLWQSFHVEALSAGLAAALYDDEEVELVAPAVYWAGLLWEMCVAIMPDGGSDAAAAKAAKAAKVAVFIEPIPAFEEFPCGSSCVSAVQISIETAAKACAHGAALIACGVPFGFFKMASGVATVAAGLDALHPHLNSEGLLEIRTTLSKLV